MSQKMNIPLNELQKFQSTISKKILMKFGDHQEKDGWGWFVDLELNYNNNIFNKNKYNTSKQFSILETIREYPSIRSTKSINNFHDKSVFEMEKKTKTNRNSFIYIRVITSLIIIFLVYILI
jgi:hypothetical protein